MMLTVQLFHVNGNHYGINKEMVSAIVGRHHEKVLIEYQDNREILLLSKGRKAVVYDLETLFYDQQGSENGQASHLLVINIGTELISLQASGLGGVISAAEEQFRPLPPIFGQEAQTIFPLTLVNGTDTILLLDPKALHACFKLA